MKITTNDYTKFNSYVDIFPNPSEYGIYDFLLEHLSQSQITQLREIISNKAINYEYYARSKNKELNEFIRTVLEFNGLVQRGDYYTISFSGGEVVVGMILDRYFDKWVKLAKTITTEYDYLAPYNIKVSDKMLTEHTESELVSSMQEDDKIYGFNATNGRNSNARTNTNTDTNTTDHNSDRSITRIGNIGNTSFQELTEQERKILNYQIFDTIYNDLDEIFSRAKYIY